MKYGFIPDPKGGFYDIGFGRLLARIHELWETDREAMATALAGGAQVLLLLPEIALTQPFLDRVESRFGCEPGQWHSDLRPRERERFGSASVSAPLSVADCTTSSGWKPASCSISSSLM